MQVAVSLLNAIRTKSDRGRLESRMMRKCQVRFGGRALEKGLRATSPMSYPTTIANLRRQQSDEPGKDYPT
jgi:hypothetical protein